MSCVKRLTTLFLFLNFVCSVSAQQATENDIQELINDYYQTMSERDWEAYREFFTPDATLTTVWKKPDQQSPQINTASIEDFIAQTSKGPDSQPIFEEKPTSIEVKVVQGLASVWARYEAKFGSSDELMEWSGYDLFSLIRYDGQWKIVSIVYESEQN